MSLNVREFHYWIFLIVCLSIASAGCKEATIEPDLTGSIEGRVFDRETEEPLAGVSISTSPPSVALATDGAGEFSIEDVDAGNYTITASKRDYTTNTVTVAVSENATRQAVIFLEPEDEEDEIGLKTSITNWSNNVSNDSVYVSVEYRALNTGGRDIPVYEIYFRIDAGDNTFYHEVAGDDLGVGQMDVGRFQRYIESNVEADSVRIDDYYFEGQD